MKKLLFLFIFLPFISKAQVSKNSETSPVDRKQAVTSSEAKPNQLPADYPKYINTGNADADQAAYDEAVVNWHQQNPGKFVGGFKGEIVNGVVVVTRKDFETLSQRLQQMILSEPEKYQVK